MLIEFRASREPVGGGHGIGIRNRLYFSPSDYGYRIRVIYGLDGVWSYVMERIVLSAATTMVSGSTGVVAAPNVSYSLRLRTTGASPTTVRARFWRTDTYEPSTWLVDTTDSTAGLQTAGTFNIRARAESGFAGDPMLYSVDRVLGLQL